MAKDAPLGPRRVFLSSTNEDLRPYALAAKAVLLEQRFEVEHFKDWEATGRPPVSECRKRVEACDALVVLVGSVYGWVPPVDQDGDGRSSITRLEVGWARMKQMAVLPFFVRPEDTSGSLPAVEDVRLAEFVAELGLGKFVSTPEALRDALRLSLESLDREYQSAVATAPQQVGLPKQGHYQEFRDRHDARAALLATLRSNRFRGASIVGKGGFGKSALANCMIEELRRDRRVDVVIYLNAARTEPISERRLFMSTMEASGKPKVAYEGSWAWLSSDRQRLVEVLLDVYCQRRILLLLDALEHNIDDSGELGPPAVRSFVEAFLLADHASKLLITTREAPALSASETELISEILLDRGLPVPDSVAWLMAQLPAGQSPSSERLSDVVRSVYGVPFAVERLAELVRRDPLLDLGESMALDDALDRLFERAYSTLSSHARMTLQARSVFDEEVPADALISVLSPELPAVDVQSAIRELGRSHFLFKVGSGLLGMHEIDHDSSYRSLVHDRVLDRHRLHRRAAEYYARGCQTRENWLDWTTHDELENDIKRFKQLVKAGDPVAAANAFSFDKLWFLNWSGNVGEIRALFSDLDVGAEPTRALLIKKFALADALAVTGPFDRAIVDLKATIELARSVDEVDAELPALYDLGVALRYEGHGDDAVAAMQSLVEKLRQRGDETLVNHALFGYSLACTYAGRYVEAIRSGRDQVRFGHRTGEPSFVGRGNSCLCIVYYLVGWMEDARRSARESAEQFVNTSSDNLVGFIENVHGLALHGLGENGAALQAFERARTIARRTAQRRADGLAATNWAWVLYSQGGAEKAIGQIKDAIRVFADISEPDLRLANHLREAFEYALDDDREPEAEALWNFVRSSYVNPDLVRGDAVAERIIALGDRAGTDVRHSVDSFLAGYRIRLAAILADLTENSAKSV